MGKVVDIDINCDVGEVPSSEKQYVDHLIMPYITSCNIACGGHAGDAQSVEETIHLAKEHNVKVGAHPSYPDRQHFGRKSMIMSQVELHQTIRDQILLCKQKAEDIGVNLTHVKPHGALYNDMANDESLALVVVNVICEIDPELNLFCMADSCIVEVAKSRGIRTIQEVFGDRRYTNVNRLMSRTSKGAVLTEDAAIRQQLLHFINGKVQIENGSLHSINAETICVHSDTPHVLEIIHAIRNQLETHHVKIVAYT